MHQLLHILGSTTLLIGGIIVLIYGLIFMTQSSIDGKFWGVFMFLLIGPLIIVGSCIWCQKMPRKQRVDVIELLPELPDKSDYSSEIP